MALSVNELRIGNLVLYESVEIVLSVSDLIVIDLANKQGYDHKYKPIPLTEEWLLKFGFKRERDLNWWNVPKESSYKAHHLMKMQNAWTWFIDFDDTGDNTHLVSGFNYVHQLQNLYFALTGEELTIK